MTMSMTYWMGLHAGLYKPVIELFFLFSGRLSRLNCLAVINKMIENSFLKNNDTIASVIILIGFSSKDKLCDVWSHPVSSVLFYMCITPQCVV